MRASVACALKEIGMAMSISETTITSSSATPYGTRPTRWVRPVLLGLVLVVFDEQGFIAFLFAAFLILGYLPRSLIAKKYSSCRKERLIRLAIYLSAVAMVLGLRIFNTSLAKGRAEQIITAAENYKVANGKYPDRLDQLVPQFIPEVPAKAKLTLLDNGFRYLVQPDSHTLMYVVMPPFGRRTYQFETRQWGDLD